MATLMTFFILTWYEASAPWWVAFWLLLALRFGDWFVTKYDKQLSKYFGLED